MTDTPKFEKYTYFVTEDELQELEQELKLKKQKLKKARITPCEVLHPKRKVAVAPPKIWSGACWRQGSWYRVSANADKYLIGSDDPIAGLTGGTRVVLSDFAPPRLPTPEEMEALAQDPVYLQNKPDEWDQIRPQEESVYQINRQTLGVDTLGGSSLTLKEIFPLQCANHANFLNPAFYIEENGCKAPYSIAGSLSVCSACLEIFGVIGTDFPIRYVVPCPGALLSVGFEADSYLRVEDL